MNLEDFVRESNRIEGILRDPTGLEIAVHEDFLALCEIKVEHLVHFVKAVAGAPLRDKPGMNVTVGNHHPLAGGPHIRELLTTLLEECVWCLHSPYDAHVRYETLHPFMDGNGRSGRALWLWMHYRRDGERAWQIGFLHRFYYETLAHSRLETAEDRIMRSQRDEALRMINKGLASGISARKVKEIFDDIARRQDPTFRKLAESERHERDEALRQAAAEAQALGLYEDEDT